MSDSPTGYFAIYLQATLALEVIDWGCDKDKLVARAYLNKGGLFVDLPHNKLVTVSEPWSEMKMEPFWGVEEVGRRYFEMKGRLKMKLLKAIAEEIGDHYQGELPT